MAITRIRCKRCETTLKSSSGFRPGGILECPKCGTKLRVPQAKKRPPQERKRPAATRDEFDEFDNPDDEFDELPAPRRRPRSDSRRGSGRKGSKTRSQGKSASAGMRIALISVAIGGVGIVAGIIIASKMSGGGGEKVAAKGDDDDLAPPLRVRGGNPNEGIAREPLPFDPNNPNGGNGQPNNAPGDPLAGQQGGDPQFQPGVDPQFQPEGRPLQTQPQPQQPSQPSRGGSTPVASRPKFDPLSGVDLPKLAAPPGGAAGGQLTAGVLKRVKGATVMLRVVDGEDREGSGSGFFAMHKTIVVTNAHVVGMLKPGSRPPRRLEVVLDSGETTELAIEAAVVGVDRSSDLAVVRLTGNAPTGRLPQPLSVYSAKSLLETQQVYVFGFPFGEQLGKNITVSKSSVSSMRKDSRGELNKVQVNGGMHPGNSGGPVTDSGGNVIGVAVSIIEGTQLNFAIPGDKVHALFSGRVTGISLRDGRQKDRNRPVYVNVELLDPLGQVKSVSVDWWSAKNAGSRAPAQSQPRSLPGDGRRQSAQLSFNESRTGAFAAVQLPPDKSAAFYHFQPRIERENGQTVWLASAAHEPPPIVDPQPVKIALRHSLGDRKLHLNSRSEFAFESYDGEDLKLLSHIDTDLKEGTLSIREGIARKRVGVGKLEFGLSINGQAPPRTRQIQQMMQDLRFMFIDLSEDATGNYLGRRLDLRGMPRNSQSLLGGVGSQIEQSLDTVAVPLPGKVVQPGERWQAVRSLPINTPGALQTGRVMMTYIYRGMCERNGRKSALIALQGALQPVRSGAAVLFGSVSGVAYYDLAADQISYVTTNVNLQIRVQIDGETFKASGNHRIKLDRGPVASTSRTRR